MKPVLQQLLAHAPLGARLVAGERGIGGRPTCQSIHLTDNPDPTPWLQGGELIVTTGLLLNSERLQREFVERLAAHGCVGLGYSAADRAGVPSAIVEAAERVGLPVFELPYQIPLTDVTMFVTKLILDSHYSALRTAVRLHRRMLAAITQDAGLAVILEVAGAELRDYGLVMVDYYGLVLAEYDPQNELQGMDFESLRLQAEQTVVHVAEGGGDGAGRVFSSWPVRVGGETEGFLIAVGPRAVDEHEELLLEQVIAGATMTLARELSIRRARRALVSELVEGLATNQVSQQVLAERVRKVGLEADQPFRMICVPVARGRDPDDVCRLIEDELVGIRPAVGFFDGAVYAIVSTQHERAAADVHAALGRRGWQALIGRSRRNTGADGLVTAYRESSAAARQAPSRHGVHDVEDLDVVSLLGGHTGELAELIVERVLGPVIAHDLSEGSRLLESLAVFLRHGCKPGPAAGELFVHRHTLAYRLDRIAAITGRDPRNGAHLLEFSLALELFGRAAAADARGKQNDGVSVTGTIGA